ncbi:MAG: carbonic anhydrase [Bacteroidales bacterium]
MYIGCSDSRVTAESMMGLDAGELFVYRNIANVVNNNDLSALSVIHYAVNHLKVKHIIVCGHYFCGGVKAAMQHQDLAILNPWLRNIRDIYHLHKDELNVIEDADEKYKRLIELNVEEQCTNVLKTMSVQRSFLKTGYPKVHGWVYDIQSGLLIDMNFDYQKKMEEIQEIYDLGLKS